MFHTLPQLTMNEDYIDALDSGRVHGTQCHRALPEPWLCRTSLLRRVWTLHLWGQDTTTQGQSVSSCFYKEKGMLQVWTSKVHLSQCPQALQQRLKGSCAHHYHVTLIIAWVSRTLWHQVRCDSERSCGIQWWWHPNASSFPNRSQVEGPMTMWGWSNAHAQTFLWPFSLESGQDTSLIASRMLSWNFAYIIFSTQVWINFGLRPIEMVWSGLLTSMWGAPVHKNARARTLLISNPRAQ